MLFDRLDPTERPPALHNVLTEQRAKLADILDAIELKLTNPTLSDPNYADSHLADYRIWVRYVNDVETIFLPLCDLWDEDAEEMQGVLSGVCDESRLPADVRRPVIALYGSEYQVGLITGIIYAPRMERHFLLHLPDLYHELGHLIVIKHWEVLWVQIARAIANHFDPLIQRGRAVSDPMWHDGTYQTSLDRWRDKWIVEFTCDIIGTLLCGPAYAWAHLHLCASHDMSVYQGGETHPADHARFQLIAAALDHLGEAEQREHFSEKWESFTSTLNQPIPAAFATSYPSTLLGLLVRDVHDGLVTLGMRIYDAAAPEAAPTAALLNQAWAAFWDNPQGYRQWEIATNGRLQQNAPSQGG